MDETSLSITELAARWHCAYLTVYNMVKEKKIKAFKVGSGWRISMKTIEDYENK